MAALGQQCGKKLLKFFGKDCGSALWSIIDIQVPREKNFLGHTRYLHNGDPAVWLACDVLSQNIGRIIPGIQVYSLGW